MKTPDPNNDNDWMTHAEYMKRERTKAGAPRPSGDSPLWNDWAANNPTPEARALGGFDFVKPMLANLTGITKGARPVDW